MTNQARGSKILWIECIGFALIILLSWLDELVGLPRLLFGGRATPNWHESAVESLVALVVWLVVFVSTRRVIRRFTYLEKLVQMCAWCRKLEHHGDWTSLEDYCAKELNLDISHGLCPKCGRKMLEKGAQA